MDTLFENPLRVLAKEIAAGDVIVLSPELDAELCEVIRQGFPSCFPYEGAVLLWTAPSGDSDDLESKVKQSFLSEVARVAGLNPAQGVQVQWDAASAPALRMPMAILQEYLDELDLPAHLYIVALDGSWCVCFRFEGEMGFGYARQQQ